MIGNCELNQKLLEYIPFYVLAQTYSILEKHQLEIYIQVTSYHA